MGPTVTGPIPDPLAMLLLNNRLYMVGHTQVWGFLRNVQDGTQFMSECHTNSELGITDFLGTKCSLLKKYVFFCLECFVVI